MKPGYVAYEGYSLADAKASVGPGWSGILERLWAAFPEGTVIVQVKEKYGKLRIYQRGSYQDIEDLLVAAEAESGTTCEECGAKGSLTTDDRWMKVLCPVCMEKAGRT